MEIVCLEGGVVGWSHASKFIETRFRPESLL